MSSSGDCALALAPIHSSETRGALQKAAPTVSRTPSMHRAPKPLTTSADGRVTTGQTRHVSGEEQVGKGGYPCFPSPGERRYGCLRRSSRLQMNSLRSALTTAAPATNRLISGQRKTSDMTLPNDWNTHVFKGIDVSFAQHNMPEDLGCAPNICSLSRCAGLPKREMCPQAPSGCEIIFSRLSDLFTLDENSWKIAISRRV